MSKLTKVIKGISMFLIKLPRLFKKGKKEPENKVVRSHKFELKKASIHDYINIKRDDRLIQEFKEHKEGFYITGEKEGNQGIPKHDILGLSATMQKWKAKHSSLIKQIIPDVEFKITEQKTIHKNFIENLEEYTREERIQLLITQLKLKREKRWFRNPFRIKQIEQTYQEEHEQLLELINQESAEQNDLLRNRYHQVYPKKRLTDYTFLYVFFLLVITFGEFPLNVSGLQHLGEFSNIFVLILSGFFAIILGYSAHSVGHALYKKHTKEWIAGLIIGLAVCTLVGVLRSSLDGSFIMSLMNILVFGFGCFVSYDRARNIAFWSSVRRKKKLQRIKNRKQAKWVRTNNKYRAEAEKEVRDQENELRFFIDSIGLLIASIEAYKDKVIHTIDGIYEEGIAAYRNANTLSRLKVGHPAVLMWEEKTRSLKDQNNGSFKARKFMQILIFVFGMGLLGCNSPATNDSIILFDVTDQVALKSLEKEKVASFLLNEVLELEEGDLLSQGVRVTISSIGATSIQYTKSVELPPGGSFLSRTEKNRKEEIENFKIELQNQVKAIAVPKKDIGQTVLMHNLCGHLNDLSDSKARKKSVIVFGDMHHNTSELSFYRYKNDAQQILENHENLAAKMDKMCLLPSLDNISLTIVYLPTEKTDRLFQAVKNFWARYLEDYGAEVNFLPNI